MHSCRLGAARLVAVLLLAVLALAWGGVGVGAAAVPAAVPTLAQLQKALLTPADLPADVGFEEVPLPSGAGVNSFGPCPYVAEGPQPFEEADALYASGTTGIDVVSVAESLEQYSVSDAKKSMAQFAGFAAQCNGLSFSILGATVAFDIAPESFPPSGTDGTVALRLVTRIVNAGNLLIDTDLVAVRHGGTVIVITNTAAALPGSQLFSPTLTRVAVAAAYAKVAALW
jgi:hypothetical protein